MGRGGAKKKTKKDEGPEIAKMDADIFKVASQSTTPIPKHATSQTNTI
jgi:hypothetical protein